MAKAKQKIRPFVMLLALFGAISMPASAQAATNAHDFSFTAIGGASELPLKDFAGKAVLIVNTASFCGFTSQYDGLQALWDRYRERGLVVLGVPSNDFGSQEPGTATDIKDFCEVNFSITFPLAEKVKVKGEGAHPFYGWARQELGIVAAPKWNFHKYLVAPDGTLVDWFSSVTAPDAAKLVKAVEKVLPR